MKLKEIVKGVYPHKWTAVFQTDDGKTKHTSFGHSDYQDYTQHHDIQRRANYRTRHASDLQTKDPTKAGYLSYYILWGDSTSFQTNLASYKRRFGL